MMLFPALILQAQQDSIMNPGMERWGPNTQYDELLDWTTLNPAGALLGATLAFKTTDPSELHSGDHAVKLVTQEIQFFGVTPSILTSGFINTTTQQVEGGKPINSRPTSLSGWFRFDPVTVDTGFASVALTKWNSGAGASEPIGSGSINILNTSGVFVNLEVEINYISSETPDTVLITIGSGTPAGEVGTALFVDDLYYTFPSSIETPESVGLSLYPNPVSDFLTIKTNQGLAFTSATVFALDGRMIYSTTLVTNTSKLDMSNLKTGAYVVELSNVEGIIVRQQFLKN